jgi:hypothetical protein
MMYRIAWWLCVVVLLHVFGQAKLWADEEGRHAPGSAPTSGASLSGRVLYGGEPPEPGLLPIPLRQRVRNGGLEFDTEELPGRRRLMEQGVPDESLIVGEDRGLANVIVWVTSYDVPAPKQTPKPLPPATLRAVNWRLSPHVLVFWNVSRLELVNDCGEATNFNLMLASVNTVVVDGQKFEVDIKRAMTMPSPVRSNLHPWFNAYLMALRHPYFAVTDEDGRFKITGLPSGEWKFALWHEKRGFLSTDKYPHGRFALEIEPGDNQLGDLTVEPIPHVGPMLQPVVVAAPRFRRLDAAPVLEPGTNSLSELHRAVMAGDADRVNGLLRLGTNVNEREPRLNGTPLHYAAREGHAEIVRMLAEKGANVNARDINNCTPLMWAAKGGHADIVRTLLDAEATIEAREDRGWTALHFAIDRGHMETSRLLIERGAKQDARNRDGKTPFELKPENQPEASP